MIDPDLRRRCEKLEWDFSQNQHDIADLTNEVAILRAEMRDCILWCQEVSDHLKVSGVLDPDFMTRVLPGE